jgi:fumarate hydratase class II
MKTRIESDSMGELKVPEDALYGAQTQRAINNFPVSGKSMPEAFVRALLVAKSAAAASKYEFRVVGTECRQRHYRGGPRIVAKSRVNEPLSGGCIPNGIWY